MDEQEYVRPDRIVETETNQYFDLCSQKHLGHRFRVHLEPLGPLLDEQGQACGNLVLLVQVCEDCKQFLRCMFIPEQDLRGLASTLPGSILRRDGSHVLDGVA